MLAAAYLQVAVERSAENPYWQHLPALPEQDELNDAHLVAAILAASPDVIAATLYLWNVARTLKVLATVKRRRPDIHVIVGGPEVARRHPLLYRTKTVDVAVIGEGEPLFASLLSARRETRRTDWARVAHREGRTFRWGSQPTPIQELALSLPPPEHPSNRPDAQGMAYLETTRGCPMRCAFCCYNQRREGISALPADEVQHRVNVLRRRGAREIRLIDPTFNASPHFRETLQGMRAANPDRRVAFFVELRADSLSDADASLLAAAGVTEAEVGVQCTNRAVLRRIHRPVELAAVERGVDLLLAHGIRPTLDMMAGLPGQTADDLTRAIDWLVRFPRAHPQLLHTLLLPGTELRRHRARLGLNAQSMPPYRVLSSTSLSAQELTAAEREAIERLGGAPDHPTPQFVGTHLDELFEDALTFDPADPDRRISGRAARCTVHLQADTGMSHLPQLCRRVRSCLRREPHALWQFILHMRREEPFDLIDRLIEAIDAVPGHYLDRLLLRDDGQPVRAARRVRVLLDPTTPFDPVWREALEATLADAFF